MSAKVLLIDDDQDFRVSVRSLLETRGYEVFEAGSGHEGLRQVLEHKPDVILLDVMMETSVEGYGVTTRSNMGTSMRNTARSRFLWFPRSRKAPMSVFPCRRKLR